MIDTEYFPEGPYVLHSASGRIDTSHLLAAIKNWFTHPAFDPGVAVVWDLRSAYLDMSLEDLSRMYASVRDAVDNKRAGGRTAWVHESKVITAFIEIVGEAFDWGSQWGCFSSVSDAVNWSLGGE